MSTSSNEPNETVAPAAPGGWEPIPQSEGYDEGATAFVHLPPEFMLDGVPLEAPGHGYTPPMIVPLQPLTQTAPVDPEASGWPAHLSTEGVEFLSPEPGPEPLPHGYGEEPAAAPTARPYADHDPHATAEWHFGAPGQWEAAAAPAPAPAEPVVERAEPLSYEQAPPTLPGGAAAPWAVREAAAGTAGELVGELGTRLEQGPETEFERGAGAGTGAGTGFGHDAEVGAGAGAGYGVGPEAGAEFEREPGAGFGPEAGGEPEAVYGHEAGAEAGFESGAGAGTAPEAEFEAGYGHEGGAGAGFEAGVGPEAGAGHEPEPESGYGHEGGAGTGFETGVGPEAGAGHEPEPESGYGHEGGAGTGFETGY
ncbi:hypothetical protein ACFXKE_36820, partial [Streptomyces sp. NPDC059202]